MGSTRRHYPRATATIFDAAALRFLNKYNVRLEALQARDEAALNELLKTQIPPAVELSFTEAAHTIELQMTELMQAMQEGMKLDMAQTMMGKMMEGRSAQMQGQMTKMQDIMARTQKTSDPAERQKLMTEHMQAMQEGMKTMRGMSGTMQGMTGYKEEAGSGMGGGGPMSPEMMELRVNMMQMMIEQMMQHQKASESPQK